MNSTAENDAVASFRCIESAGAVTKQRDRTAESEGSASGGLLSIIPGLPTHTHTHFLSLNSNQQLSNWQRRETELGSHDETELVGQGAPCERRVA